MTITKLKQLDENNVLTDEQYHLLKTKLNSLEEELPEQLVSNLIKFIGVQNGRI